MKKKCPKCKKRRDSEHFYENKFSKDGLDSYCKDCKNKIKQYKRKNKIGYYAKENKTLHSATYVKRIKNDVFDHYGKNCSVCGFADMRALSIDHVNGGGNVHRKQIRASGGGHFYKWLRRNNYPTGFQTLCMNCQFIKRVENGECNRQK